MMKREVEIPEQLKHSLFFSEKERVEWPAEASLSSAPFFIYELSGEGKPWLVEDKGLDMIEKEWFLLKAELESKFQRRDRDTQVQMKAAIALFLMKLFWGNGQPVRLNGWDKQVKKLDVQPVNVTDRLAFVFHRPYSYHSYRQVRELMIEQDKLLAKKAAMKEKK
ncbi:YpoC family protein [Pseudobacillus badius]|uniref:YpoC family protein n=1 Tax=Bacillus badius TaxID=1455 RepID=UPI002555BC96|nr:hypothetical protein [Bacillus badius]